MAMGTTATKNEDDDSYTLNGTKMWITNGTVDGTDTGDVFLVYARTQKPSDDPKAGKLTSFLVEKGMPGFTLGSKIMDKLGRMISSINNCIFGI